MHPGKRLVRRPTGAVLCYHCITVKSSSTNFTTGPCGVVHAACAGPGQRVTIAEEHVGVSIPTAVTGLAGAANHEWVTIVTWSTPWVERRRSYRSAMWSPSRVTWLHQWRTEQPHPALQGSDLKQAKLEQLNSKLHGTVHTKIRHNQACKDTAW